MKSKSYEILVTSFVILLIVSLVFFSIVKEKKTLDLSVVNKITPINTPLNIDKLTPLEKEVWDKFKKIPKNEYPRRYREIAENNRVLLNINSTENVGAYILKEVLKSGTLSPKDELYILNKLRVLDSSSGNIVNIIKLTMDYLNLAEDLNSEYDVIRAKISLSWIFTNLEGYDTAIKILNKIDIKSKNLPEALRIKASKNFYLAENYVFLKEYDKALKHLNEIPNLDSEPIEYQNNISILKTLLYSRIYTDLDKPKLAKENLARAHLLLSNLKKFYFIDIENFYFLSLESYNLKYDFKKFSPSALENFIESHKIHGDVFLLKIAYNLLFTYYFKIEDFNSYRRLSLDYDGYLNKITSANNQVFTLYLIENLEREHFAEENEALYKNMTILLISIFFILGVSYVQLQSLNRKSKLDALTNIGNRLAFNEKMSSLENESYSMLLFDIDNFKKINDTYGHNFGDEVLFTIGKILKEIENNEVTIYRVGGEEFTILFTHFNDIFTIERCEHIRKTVENIQWKYPITVTISGGFSKSTKNTYIECDKRLYKAKSSGKNMIIYQDINEGDIK